MQLARDGRRVLWLAHESAPKNFTAVDVTDPRAPKVIVQTDLPHAQMRSNSLEVAGDLMAVAYQVTKFGLKPAGFELFDISTPEKPKSIAAFRRVRARIRAAATSCGSSTARRCTWPAPTRSSSRATRRTTRSTASSTWRIRRSRCAVGRWHLPGTMDGDDAPPPQAPAGQVRRRLSRAQHQRLSRAARPLLPRVHRRRHHGAGHQRPRAAEAALALDQLAAVQRLQPHRAAALRPRPAGGERRVRAGQRRRLAEAGAGCSTRATSANLVSVATLPAPPVDAFKTNAAAASARTTCTRTRRCRAPGARRTSCSAPSSMPACAPTT